MAFFSSLLAAASEAAPESRMIVIVPGVMGSKLCDSEGKIIWGDRSSYTEARINALRLPPDVNKRDKGIHSCGIIESVNIIPLLWEVDVYDSLLSFLYEINFREEDVLVFDYDWRLSNFDNAQLLKSKIEALPQKRIDIISHSMGGIIARIYFQELGGKKRINDLFMIGTPHYGSAKIFERLQDGFDNWPSVLSGGLSEIQTTILSFPSTYELLPLYSDCCGSSRDGDPVRAQYFDIFSPSTWKKFDIPKAFKDGIYKNSLIKYLDDANKMRLLLRSPITDPGSSDRLHFIANGFIDTWSRVFFDPSTGRVSGHTTSPGDGTVLLFSATNGVPGQVQVSLREHEELFAGREPELVMEAALSGRHWTKGTVGFDQTFEDAAKKLYLLNDASVEISPRTATAGQAVSATLHLSGSALETAKVSNLKLELLWPTASARTITQSVSLSASDIKINAVFIAPMEPGAYKIRFAGPGLQGLAAFFSVLKP